MSITGAAFDHSFAKHMVEDHQKDIKEYQTEAKLSDAAGAYAKDSLPTLQAPSQRPRRCRSSRPNAPANRREHRSRRSERRPTACGRRRRCLEGAGTTLAPVAFPGILHASERQCRAREDRIGRSSARRFIATARSFVSGRRDRAMSVCTSSATRPSCRWKQRLTAGASGSSPASRPGALYEFASMKHGSPGQSAWRPRA